MISLVYKRVDALEREAGFTIIEVMVAIFILVLGVLGTVTMIDTASGITSNNKAREGAFNLSREVAEAARNVDYDALSATGATSTLQAVNGLGDASASTSGWQVARRGITYTVTVDACIYDDAKDGGRSTDDNGGYCAGSADRVTPPPAHENCAAKNPALPCVDTQPDDFRRLAITTQWTVNTFIRSSTQTVLIVNPSGGRGPRITNVTTTPVLATLTPANTIGPSTALQPCTDTGHSGNNCILFTVTTATGAGSLQWSSSDGVNKGQATVGATNTSWTFQYDLGTVGNANAVLDGNVTVSIQAFSASGAAGDLAAQTFLVNRSVPAAPSQFAGGRNDRNGPIVDLNWIRNKATDIVGYRVYRVEGTGEDWANPAGDTADTLVCGSSTTPLDATSCSDPNPPSEPLAVKYYIKAVDKDLNQALRESDGSASAEITTLATASPWSAPWPGGNGGSTATGCNTSTSTCLTPAISGGFPVLTWNNAATPASGRTILFYRVYRDPGSTTNPAYSDRWDTNGSPSLSYKDSNFGALTGHTYVITAVDDSYSESPPLGPAATP